MFLVSLLYAVLFSWAGEIMPKYISPEGFVWLRIATAFVLFNFTSIIAGWEKVDWKRDFKLFAVCAFFGTAANMYLFFKGLSLTSPINGAVLMMVTPLFVAIFDHVRLQKYPGLETILGLTIGSAGAMLLITEGKGGYHSKSLIGDLFVAVNAAFYAVYLVQVKSLVHRYKPVTVNRITFGFGLLYLTPLGLIPFFKTDFSQIPTDIVLKIGYVLFFTSYLVYLLNAYGVKYGNANLVGIYIYLQPVLATLIALGLQRDTLTLEKVMYASLILFGVWLVMANDKRGFSIKRRFQGKSGD